MDSLPVLYWYLKFLRNGTWNYNGNREKFYWFLTNLQNAIILSLWKISKWDFYLPVKGRGNQQILRTYISQILVNYILEVIRENLLTSSSTAEVNARIDILLTAQFIADSWSGLRTETIQNCSAHCSFKHSNLETQNKADSENDVILKKHVRNYESFIHRQ